MTSIKLLPRRLQTTFTLGLVAAFVLIGGLFTILHLSTDVRQKDVMRGKVEQLLHTLVERDRDALANEMFSDQRDAVLIRLKQMHNVVGVLGITAYDAEGNLLHAVGEIETRSLTMAEREAFAQGPHVIPDADAGSLSYLHPINLAGRTQGYLHLRYDLHDIAYEQALSFRLLILQLLALLVVLVLVVQVFLSHAILAPVRALQEAIGAMASGDRTVQVERLGLDELGMLGESFNRMAADLERGERARQAKDAEVRATLASLHEAVFTLDADWRVVDANPAAQHFLGATQPHADVRQRLELCNAEGTAAWPSLARMETLTDLKLADGTKRACMTTLVPITVGEREGLVLVLRDMTEQLQMGEQLRQAEKMQALGQLAGGIAHDFNNVLQVISGRSELLHRHALNNPALGKGLAAILQASDRAADLVAKLLSFARKGTQTTKPIGLHRVIEETVAMLRHSLDRRISIVVDLQAPRDVVLGNMAELQNVLLNLAVNARDAMPQGGRLFFTTGVKSLKHEDPRLELPDGLYLELVVRDSGTGIPSAVLGRIFEPFFTTKAVGSGTGLGLAAVFGTVRAHGGTVHAANHPVGGACFTILLPLIEGEDESRSRAAVQLEPAGGERLVLLVDDEPMLVSLGHEMLVTLGFQVITAENGMAAVEIFRRYHGAIAGVITDRNMPGITGEECFQQLRAIDPSIPVILATGHIDEVHLQHLRSEGLAGVLHKPFNRETLDRVLRESLGPLAPQPP